MRQEKNRRGLKDYGIYTQVEQLNKTALEAHGLDLKAVTFIRLIISNSTESLDAIRKEDDLNLIRKIRVSFRG